MSKRQVYQAPDTLASLNSNLIITRLTKLKLINKRAQMDDQAQLGLHIYFNLISEIIENKAIYIKHL